MNTFDNVLKEAKEAMVKYMDAFIELAKLMPEIGQADIDALQFLSKYVKDGSDLAPEVADGYRAVYDRVYDMIFTGSTKQTPYTSPIKGMYQHRVNYKDYGSPISRRDEKLRQLVFDTYENEPDDNNSELNKWVNHKMTFCFKNRDQAIEFIDKLRDIIRLASHVTINQAFKLRSTIVKKNVLFDNVSDTHLIGWDDLSCMVGKDGSYDDYIIEAFVPMHYCTVTLPESKYLTEE